MEAFANYLQCRVVASCSLSELIINEVILMRLKSGVLKILSVLTVILMFATFIPAQTPTARMPRMHGYITDPSGAVITGAIVSAKATNGQTSNAKSDRLGVYDLKTLSPGKYTL